MAKIIYDNMNISVLESHISNLLQGLEYWGDLNLSNHEYETLKRRLSDAIQNGTSRSDLDVLWQYPVCTVTVAVFLMRYEFDANFWGAFEDALNITLYPQTQGVVGDLFLQTIRRYHFQSAPQSDKRKYVATLQFQLAAPPDSTISDLFFVMQNDASRFFDPYMLLESLTTWRAYLIRKPLLSFLERFPETRALDLVTRVHETMQAVDSGANPDDSLAELYIEWLSQEKRVRSSQKSGEKDWQPHLIYEPDGRGLCMVLPAVSMKENWIEEVRWEITNNTGENWRCLNRVFASRGTRYTAECSVAVRPSENYTVELFHVEAEEECLGSKIVSGINRTTVLLFDTNGLPLMRSNWLPEHGVILLAGPEAHWQDRDGFYKEQLYAPMLGEFTAWRLTPMSGRANLTCVRAGTTVPAILQIRSHAKLNYDGETLFGLPLSFWTIPVFIEFPCISILTEDEQDREDLTLVLAGQKYVLSEKDETISLANFLSAAPEYGKYSLRLYQGHQLIQFSEFFYLPEIESDYSPDYPWNRMSPQTQRFLHFTLPENISLEFSNATCTETPKGMFATFSPECAKLEGFLRFQQAERSFSVRVELPVLPCSWRILDSTAPDETIPSSIPMSDFVKKNFLLRVQLYGSCVKDFYHIILRSVNGIEQQIPLWFHNRNTASLLLNAFADTISHIPLPAVLLLCNESHPNDPVSLLFITETPEFLSRPVVGKNRKNLYFAPNQILPETLELTAYGKSGPTIRLDCSSAELITAKGQSRLTIGCSQQLMDGVYIVTSSSQQEIDFLWKGTVPLTVRKNIFTVPSCVKVRPENIQTPKSYIQQAVYDILRYSSSPKANFADSCCMQVNPASDWRNIALDETDLIELMAIAEFTLLPQISHRMKRQICILMQRISETFLNGRARWELLCHLVQIHCSQEVFDMCRSQYSLILFESFGNQEFCLEIARELKRYNSELALLVLEQRELSIRAVLQDNLKVLGQEAVFSMLGVPANVDVARAQEMRKEFLLEQPGNGVEVVLSKELSGDMKLVSETIQIDGFHVSLNYQPEKVVDALFFDQNRYVDLYANWAINTEYRAGTEDYSRQREIIVCAVKDGQRILTEGLQSLRFGDEGWLVRPYARALSARQAEGCMQVSPTVPSYPRFFYLMGIAALLFRLNGSSQMPLSLAQAAELFLARAGQVAPRMLQRDLVMASTYVYLKKKERSLWQ